MFLTVDIYYEASARLFSAADRCFPRARLQPPRGKTPLWGLQARAVPRGVNGSPLQTTIINVLNFTLKNSK